MTINYPADAAEVRDAIAAAMKPHANHNSPMDTGGAFGCADLWLQIGSKEYVVSVKPVRDLPHATSAVEDWRQT